MLSEFACMLAGHGAVSLRNCLTEKQLKQTDAGRMYPCRACHVCAYRIKVQLCLVRVLHSIFTSVWHLCILLKSAEMILLVAAFDFFVNGVSI